MILWSSCTYDSLGIHFMQWDGRFLDKIFDLWWLVIWVKWGGDCGSFPLLGGRWHKKRQKNDPNYYFLGHNRAMTNRYITHIDRNHMDHTQINQQCRGCTGGRLEWEWGCYWGFQHFIVNIHVLRSFQTIIRSSWTYEPLWMQWDGRFLDKMVDLGWLVIWVRWGDDCGSFLLLGDRWHE